MVESKHQNTTKTFFSGMLMLTVSTVLVKIIGLFYKIPMLSYLGSEGMGYFNSAYEIYALFCVIATAGFPVALSILISDSLARTDIKAVQRIYRAAMVIFLLIGLGGSGVMWLLAPQFCQLIKSENAYFCILSIAPTVFFVCISSALRGYFQGYQKMMPTAISQVLESVGKLVFGLLLARFALHRGYETPVVAAFAGTGLTLGTALSLLYLIIAKLRFHPHEEAPTDTLKTIKHPCKGIWKDLSRLAIPMTLGASMVSITKLIDMTMILRRLQSIGYTEAMANRAYGSYTTLALSVFGLVPTLINSIALPLVPTLSAAIAQKDKEREERLVATSYRLTSLVALPASLAITVFSKPILSLLFAGSPDDVSFAAPLLSYLGISIFLSCMITATNSVLHAYQAVNRPIVSLLAGAAIKIVSAYIFIGIQSIGLNGSPISTFLCNATVVLLNLYFCTKLCNLPTAAAMLWRPVLSAAGAVGISYGVYRYLTAAFGETQLLALLCMLLTVILYLIVICRFGAIEREELLALPGGAKIEKLLEKLHLLPTLK